MAAEFRAGGHEIVESAGQADLVVVNSCAVTAAAASDSRQKVRQAHKAGAQNILLTGCWATISQEEALALPGVSSVVANNEKDEIPLTIMHGKTLFELEPLERRPLPGSHRRTRAFIKVQDGCDNHCTFCITRIARGASKSIDKRLILEQVHSAEEGGTHEVVLSGVNLGAWGRDMDGEESLADLIRLILNNSKIDRLRLSSIEPWDMDDAFLELWQDGRMCRHLHIPLQSGSAEILKRMVRRTTPDRFKALISQVRKQIPQMAITTDVIVGFAGESAAEFEESLAFVQEIDFAGGHVFRYSPRPGTPAANLPGSVNGREAHLRSERMREVLQKSEQEYHRYFIGDTVSVLWESSKKTENGQWRLHGLTENYLPVSATSKEDRWNMMNEVKLISLAENTIEGTIIHYEETIQASAL